MKKKHIVWRKATVEEINEGLNHPDNPDMIVEQVMDIEVPDEPPVMDIIDNLTDEQLEKLKEKLDIKKP